MSPIVKTNRWEARSFEHLLKLVRNFGVLKECAIAVRKDKVVLMPLITCRGFSRFLLPLMNG